MLVRRRTSCSARSAPKRRIAYGCLEACAFHFLAAHRHQRFEVLERSRRPFALALRCFAPGGAPLAFGLFVFAPALALAPGAPGGAPARRGQLDPMPRYPPEERSASTARVQ